MTARTCLALPYTRTKTLYEVQHDEFIAYVCDFAVTIDAIGDYCDETTNYLAYNMFYNKNGKVVAVVVFDCSGKGGPMPTYYKSDIHNA